ncbi:hemerythrin domain-containing protein [Massilia sp. AB1]|nr:hemerythrin domain-containing protein [Massilia sp. AB1]MBQ5938934.1 hemerythrin domain-containing protein [Massilia sp. AB1]
MSAFLQGDMPAMLAEHRAIAQALDRLRAAGRKEGKKEAVAFAAHLKAHARQEEEILYPTAILVGRYLKLQQQ